MKQPELVYWRGSGEVRSDLLQAVKVVGYSLTVVTDIDEVLKRTPDAFPGLIVVDASAGEAEASQRVIEVSAAQKLGTVPFIFLSYQATKRSAVLKKTFSKFVPIDIPFRLQELLEKLLELCPVNVAQDAPETKAEEQGKTTQILRDAILRDPGGRQPADTKKLVIRNADPTKLVSGYGGEFFSLADKLDRIDDQALLPAHPNKDLLIRALNAMTNQSEWLGLHSRRVSYLSSVLANSLGLGPERDLKIRTTGLLLNWGLREYSALTISHDILLNPEVEMLGEISRAYLESARFVRESLEDEGVAKIIEDISAIILSADNLPTDDSLIDAHCALVPELADRGSWAKGIWDPYGAHRAVRKFLNSDPFPLTPAVVIAASRALSEASSVRLFLEPLPLLTEGAEEPGSDAQIIAEAEREAARIFEVKKQLSVELSDLRPGMKLSRPIISWDGKLILKANVDLSEELIIRLWRLSTLRPVRPPVAILAR